MRMATLGLHHVTAISANPVENMRFYTSVLGLRLVKRTVNFDDPRVYHLYYGNAAGRPGTLLTFFVRRRDRRARPGSRQVTSIRFGVPRHALEYWRQRLARSHVMAARTRCGDAEALAFRDREGLPIELVGAPEVPVHTGTDDSPVRHSIRGLHSVELTVPDAIATCALLTNELGFVETRSSTQARRLVAVGEGPGRFVDVRADAHLPEGSSGAGSVHHMAFRARDDCEQRRWLERLRHAGLDVTDVRDRKYFRSIYFHEPGGVRLEIATDAPGFAVDESPDELGTRLQLPTRLESERAALEAGLGTVST